MYRFETCCRHSPALQFRPVSGEFFFACSSCGTAGPPAAGADQARILWQAVAARCVVYDTGAVGGGKPPHAPKGA